MTNYDCSSFINSNNKICFKDLLFSKVRIFKANLAQHTTNKYVLDYQMWPYFE